MSRPAHAANLARLKRRRLVAFGDAGGIEGAFGVDAVGAVLFSGAPACGHHDAAIAG
jgi:hypothetical protein